MLGGEKGTERELAYLAPERKKSDPRPAVSFSGLLQYCLEFFSGLCTKFDSSCVREREKSRGGENRAMQSE